MNRVRVIACGALAREIGAVLARNRLDHVSLRCLPALLHNRPERIAGAVREAIRADRAGEAGVSRVRRPAPSTRRARSPARQVVG